MSSSRAEVKASKLFPKKLLLEARDILSTRDNSSNVVQGEDILLATDVLEDVAQIIMEQETGLILYYKDKCIFAIELTRKGHSRVIGAIFEMFRGTALILEKGFGEDVGIGNITRQPDGITIPVERPLAMTYPTIVVEVADSQSLESVYSSATYYLNPATTIQGVLVVKMWDPTVAGTRSLLFMYFSRAAMVYVEGLVAPIDAISFGDCDLHPTVIQHLAQLGVVNLRGRYQGSQDLACAQPGMLQYRFFSPAIIVFHGSLIGVPVIPNPHGNGFTLDLFDVQRSALRNM